MGADTVITSGTFTIGGHIWGVGFSPAKVNSERYPDWVSVVLVLLERKGTKVRASYELSLVDQCTGMPVLVHKEAPRTFGPASRDTVSVVAENGVCLKSLGT